MVGVFPQLAPEAALAAPFGWGIAEKAPRSRVEGTFSQFAPKLRSPPLSAAGIV